MKDDDPATRKARRYTAVLILLTAGVWIAWDVLVYLRVGGPATISTTAGEWFAFSLWIVLAFGLLGGHLLGSVPTAEPGEWKRLAVAAVGGLTGYALTRLL